jgi:hypothetical protein
MIDYTKLSKKQLELYLMSALKAIGIVAEVYDKSKIDNVYVDISQEYNFENEPTAVIDVIIAGQMGVGLAICDYISTIDRLDNEIMIVTNYDKLVEGQKLLIKYADYRTLNLLITNTGVVHSSSVHSYIRYAKVI